MREADRGLAMGTHAFYIIIKFIRIMSRNVNRPHAEVFSCLVEVMLVRFPLAPRRLAFTSTCEQGPPSLPSLLLVVCV